MSTKTALHRESDRQAPRFDLVRDLKASIRRNPPDASHAASPGAAGTILNLASHGVSMVTTVPVEKGESLEIEIHSESRAVHLTCLATVLWSRPEGGDNIGVGCELDEEIDQSCLDRLSAAGFLDRRQDRRLPTNLLGHGKSELNSGQTQLVRITDYSRGGMRFYTSEDVELGQRLLIKVGASDPIVTTPIWKYEVATGYFVGCSFDPDGKAFKQIQEADKADQAAPGHQFETAKEDEHKSKRMSGWIWTGAVVVILAGVAFTFDWIPREHTQAIRDTLRHWLQTAAQLL